MIICVKWLICEKSVLLRARLSLTLWLLKNHAKLVFPLNGPEGSSPISSLSALSATVLSSSSQLFALTKIIPMGPSVPFAESDSLRKLPSRKGGDGKKWHKPRPHARPVYGITLAYNATGYADSTSSLCKR